MNELEQFERNIRIIHEIRFETKYGFPIPSPSGETEDEFISKCLSAIIDEYPQKQALAICYSKWREK